MRRFFALILAGWLLCGLVPALAQGDAPISIATPEALQAIGEAPERSYVLTRDIDMTGFDWRPVPFRGQLDGAGHSVYNLRLSRFGDDTAQTVDGNHKKYDSLFAGLFSVVQGAEIRDLHIVNVQADLVSDTDCFVAGLAGFAEDTHIEGCSVQGRLWLHQSATMAGVAGLVGFGLVTVKDCAADVELVFVDTNRKIKCEEFLAAILACGYGDVEGCEVKLSGYASVYGYVHNGGIVGMYHVHRKEDEKRKGFVRGNTVDAHIRFFEKVADRRAYCKAYVGEKLYKHLTISKNKTIRFKSTEVRKYKNPLLPEKDEDPIYNHVVTPPTEQDWGYTTYTCQSCGYSYTDQYVLPLGR